MSRCPDAQIESAYPKLTLCVTLWMSQLLGKEGEEGKMPLTEQSKQYISHALLLSSQVCFSGWHIVGSLSMKDGASPFVFALYRELLASVVMLLIVRFITKHPLFIHPEDRVRFLILGFFSFVNVVGAMLALNYISATRFAIFQPCIPCIATIISIFIGLEPFSFTKAIGICCAVGGAITTEAWKEGSSNDDGEDNVTLGSIIVALQITAMACLVVFVKPVLPKYNSAVTTFFYYSIGTVFTVILFAVVAFTFDATDLYFNGSLLPWLGLAYASMFATVYTYNALAWGGRHLSPSTTTVYSTFQPVGTMILSFIIMGDVVTTPELVGGAMVVLGLRVTVYGQNYDNLFFSQRTSHEQQRDDEKDLLAEHYRISERTNQTHEINPDILDQDYSFHSKTVSLTPGGGVGSGSFSQPVPSRPSFPYYYEKLLSNPEENQGNNR